MKSTNRIKILVFIDWFRPAYKAGGPIQSVVNIIGKLTEFEFWVCTADKDLDSPNRLDNITVNEWTQNSKNCQVIYLTEANRTKSEFLKIHEHVNPSAIYFNSMFSKQFTLTPYAALRKKNSKLILAPRGMLGAGPLSSKAFKKKLFILGAKLTGYFKSITWHVSSQKEAEDVKDSFGNAAQTQIAPNLSISNEIGYAKTEKKKGKLDLFTISRIARIKNIHLTLEYLNTNLTGYINFHIYGPIEDETYWKECFSQISQLPSNIEVTHHGELHPSEVQKTINAHHFLIMPTAHENYGHAIVESFLACKPVIISDQTPWQDLDKKQVGWDIPLNSQDSFSQVIQEATDMNQETYDALSRNALEFGNSISTDKSVLEANRILFSK
jgi:glycosyltransferase involved in cell wall biosynthesis